MSEWKEYFIDEIVADYLDFRGKTPKKLGMNWGDGNIKALSANNVEKGKINFDKECYLASEELYKVWMNKGDCKKGDVVITMEAPLGNIAQIPDDNKYILSQRTLLFKTEKELVSNDFLFFVLSDKAFQDELLKNSTGSTVVGIQQKKLAKLKIKLPSLSTQRYISLILSTADAVIEKTQAAIAKYQSIKQGMLNDLFTRGIDVTTGKLRPRYEDAPELYKESKLGTIPREWDDKEIGDIGEVRMCRRVFNYETNEQGEIPFYKIGTFGKEPDAYISKELYNSYRQNFSFPNKGDILISAAGTIGRTIIYDGTPSYFQDSNIVWIDNNGALISNEYLYQVFPIVKYKTEGGTIQRLYNSILKSARFPCPSKTEQNIISERLKAIDNKLQSEQNYLHKLQQLKSGLMSDLLSGRKEVVVKEEKMQKENV